MISGVYIVAITNDLGDLAILKNVLPDCQLTKETIEVEDSRGDMRYLTDEYKLSLTIVDLEGEFLPSGFDVLRPCRVFIRGIEENVSWNEPVIPVIKRGLPFTVGKLSTCIVELTFKGPTENIGTFHNLVYAGADFDVNAPGMSIAGQLEIDDSGAVSLIRYGDRVRIQFYNTGYIRLIKLWDFPIPGASLLLSFEIIAYDITGAVVELDYLDAVGNVLVHEILGLQSAYNLTLPPYCFSVSCVIEASGDSGHLDYFQPQI